ncbi:MAG: hypothetical protein AB7D06_18685 [Pedobacter sp.]
MNKDIITIIIALLSIVALGGLALWATRYSRAKSNEYLNSDDSKWYKNRERKTLKEQLKSRETWENVAVLLTRNDPTTEDQKLGTSMISKVNGKTEISLHHEDILPGHF